MLAKPLLADILENEALTRGLGDPEARILVEWLVERTEHFEEAGTSDEVIGKEVKRLCRRGRAISRFVALWCHQNLRAAATQLAATERFQWPLPATSIDPCELMQEILIAETPAE